MNQAELEQEMYHQGKARVEARMLRNEAEGRANMNPYAQAVLRRFVLPLAEKITEEVTNAKAGRNHAAVGYLKPLDPEVVAYIAVRTTLTFMMNVRSEEQSTRGLILEIGKAMYHEYMLSIFADEEPELFYALVNDFDRRHTGTDHRLTVFKHSAKASGLVWNEWGLGAKEQVGAYLLDGLNTLGMVEVMKGGHFERGKITMRMYCTLNPDVLAMIGKIKELVSETAPLFMPCIEKPKDWTTISDGGFHTPDMRRVSPYCVKARPSDIAHFREATMPAVLSAINALQAVEWRINKRMLQAVRDVARHFDIDEIIAQAELPRPQKPEWLQDQTKDDMSEEQLAEFRNWKRLQAEWHTEMKLRGTKVGRFISATRVADKFQQFDRIYFVYQADFRGRLYAKVSGISPQGSDLQKCLIEFANGKPLLTKEAQDWFCIAGANRWGFDKATLPDRVQWVHDRKDFILRIASDPISYRDWTEADSPLQFLAWCFEYADWQAHGDAFESRLAVGMDGSCNGLQNFSAMLRDELGGKATNLVPGPKPNDIYGMVAEVTARRLAAAVETEENRESYRQRWLKHGINRSIVKRAVMTLPYGSTRFSCAEFVEADYLKAGKVPEFAKDEYRRASAYLSFPIWDSIGDVVVKAREAMDWLQDASKRVLKAKHSQIKWISPSGFPVIQTYWEVSDHRINTKLLGATKILVPQEIKEPNARRHRNGIAPNFVHSLDAAHLTLTVNAAKELGIDNLAMIHDDYGTHAADAPKLYNIIRGVFVAMYEKHQPLEEFAQGYPDVEFKEFPTVGKLDIRQVLDSPYFFS